MAKRNAGSGMIAVERRRRILDMVLKDGAVSVSKLASELCVAENTVRSDLDAMQAEGKLQRSHGGAVANDQGLPTPPYAQMRISHMQEKSWIGAAAAKLLPESGSIFINAGSTTMWLACEVIEHHQLAVTTNSPEIALVLSHQPNLTVDLLGGRVIRDSQETDGTLSEDALDNLYWDVAFYGMTAIDAQHGITSASRASALLDRRVLAHSRKIIGLCDSSKLGRFANARVGPVDMLDVLVTDRNAESRYLKMLTSAGVEVIAAEQGGPVSVMPRWGRKHVLSDSDITPKLS